MVQPYLNWIYKRKSPKRFVRQALLKEPRPYGGNTPESFYWYEMEYRSSLEERCIAHGVKLKKGKTNVTRD